MMRNLRMKKERRLLHRDALCVLNWCKYGAQIKCLFQTTCRVPEYCLDTLKCRIIINRSGRIRQIKGLCKLKANSKTDFLKLYKARYPQC